MSESQPPPETSEAEPVDVLVSVPPPPTSSVSEPPPASLDDPSGVEAAIERLREEVVESPDPSRRARLLNEIAEIEERAGDEQNAAKDYLAAYNADPDFRECLEGLLRLLERRRSIANLGKLVDALVQVASSPDEKARALVLQASFCADVQDDWQGARAAAKEATELGASAPDVAAAWLVLELAAAKLDDPALREEALAGRAGLDGDPTWRDLLRIDLARLIAASGDVLRAADVLSELAAGSPCAFVAAVALERVLRADPGLEGTDEARAKSARLAGALEQQAGLVVRAIADPREGDARSVPRHARTAAHAVDLGLRAAAIRRSLGDLSRAAAVLDEATQNAAGAPDLERLVARARVRVAELVGDTALAAKLAAARLEAEPDGGIAAALAMRVAEQAASEGDASRALEALSRAVERDPACLPARALQLDILADGVPAARFASEAEAFASHFEDGRAKIRAYLTAAYLVGTRDRDVASASRLLDLARAAGCSASTANRMLRSLAAFAGDDAAYARAVRALAPDASTEDERTMLLFESARALARTDPAASRDAQAELAGRAESAWLGRALDAFAPGEDVDADLALERLAQLEDGARARDLRLMGAIRARTRGDLDQAAERLRALFEADPSDALVATLLGDLERGRGAFGAAARVAAAAGAAADEPERAASLYLEAALCFWRSGDTRSAVESLDAANGAQVGSAAPLLAWMARGVSPDDVEGRRHAIDRAADAGQPPLVLALERFAVEATGGDPDDAERALGALEDADDPALANAGALARLLWPLGGRDEVAFGRAAARIIDLGPHAASVAAGEEVRFARSRGTAELATAAKAWLERGGGLPAALEWFGATLGSGDFAAEVEARASVAAKLPDEGREAMQASAALLELLLTPNQIQPFVAGSSQAARLANLELAPPGADPRRRGAALSALSGVLGEDAEVDSLNLAGWSAIVAGNNPAALELFRAASAARPEDVHAWEGMRSAALALADRESLAVACEQLGARVSDDARGAAFWETAALTWLELPGFDERGESALEAAFLRDPRRNVAFDKLFRRVRERKDGDRLLSLIETRLQYTDAPKEVSKLYWEQARVLREKGDPEGALAALENVTRLEPDHVGALALTGEIFLKRGMFEPAADMLSRLARVAEAPPKNRVTAGIAAVDIYENKLGRHDLALEVLVDLHKAKLSTLPVRERLARTAARTSAWSHATSILEELMRERAERDGRIEAARLAMAIYRDRLRTPARALPCVAKVLEESPTDGDAIDYLLPLDADRAKKQALLGRARDALTQALTEHPNDPAHARRLATIATALGDASLEHRALSVAVALGDVASAGRMEQVLAGKGRTPQVALTDQLLHALLAPGDEGPIAQLFALLGPTLAEALGPSLAAVGVTKKDRVDARTGLAIRNEIATWAGAFGIGTFDLYVGGKDPTAVQGIPGETPAIVVGPQVTGLNPALRGRVARELLGIVRGTTIARWRDDTTIAAIVVAACNVAKVPIQAPAYPILGEVERLISKAIARKTRNAIEPVCRALASQPQDARVWAQRARASQARIAAVAAGDASVVLPDVFGESPERAAALAREDLRAEELLRFVLSPQFLELRRALGLEAAS